jgi:hypothetical protein
LSIDLESEQEEIIDLNVHDKVLEEAIAALLIASPEEVEDANLTKLA